MDYLHQELNLNADDVVEVTINHPANVMLLDPENWEAYRNRRRFRHQRGGYAESSPVRFQAPHAGEWHVVVDLGGGPGSVRASVTIRQHTA